MQNLLVKTIKLYSYFISPLMGPRCRFVPSCSSYACEAIDRHGAMKGVFLAVKRIGKCHPFCRGGHDPVPG